MIEAAGWTRHWEASHSRSPFAGITAAWLVRLLESDLQRPPAAFSFLRSHENRVVAIAATSNDPALVLKLYRPGVRTAAEIQEEHAFLQELDAAGVPVVPPLSLAGDGTVGFHDGIHYALFPAISGIDRSGAEYGAAELRHAGALLADIHRVGRQQTLRCLRSRAPVALAEGCATYLLNSGVVPAHLRAALSNAADALSARLAGLEHECSQQRIHGDFGPWNVRWSSAGPTVLDFDDIGPGLPVQDVALFCNDLLLADGGLDEFRMRCFLDGYGGRGNLPHSPSDWFGPLRALRVLHVAAWIVSRRCEPELIARHADLITVAGWQRRVADVQRGAEQQA
jgi:Ser/Thr protein kinase RdoA (MazF antagonist)